MIPDVKSPGQEGLPMISMVWRISSLLLLGCLAVSILLTLGGSLFPPELFRPLGIVAGLALLMVPILCLVVLVLSIISVAFRSTERVSSNRSFGISLGLSVFGIAVGAWYFLFVWKTLWRSLP